MKISAIITLKKDVLDPQGKVVHQALNGMGFNNVKEVRQGKYFEINDEGWESLSDQEEKFLTNSSEKLFNKKLPD